MSLVEYSGSSSEGEDTDGSNQRRATKRKLEGDAEVSSAQKLTRVASETTDDRSKGALPLPSAIQHMFGKVKNKHQDDPNSHGGRIRSFPHVEGNWASYVYIPVCPDERLQSFLNEIMLCLRPLNFKPVDQPHISLSRTVCIRHHWIEPLIESLKASLSTIDSCLCDVKSLKLYTNDEKTRTFLSLEVSCEETNLKQYTAAVDSCFKEFKLPRFYQDPSFHFSLLWCVGDVTSQISEEKKDKLQMMTRDFLHKHPDLSVVQADQIYLKTGNKTFAFSLHSVDV